MASKQGDVWTKEEVRALRQLFGRQSNVDVAEVLDRTPKAVERKAAKLGLRKNKKYLRSLGRVA